MFMYMQESWSYIRDSGYFLKKVKHIGKTPERAILVTADIVVSYPSIPHEPGLETLRKRLIERES